MERRPQNYKEGDTNMLAVGIGGIIVLASLDEITLASALPIVVILGIVKLLNDLRNKN